MLDFEVTEKETVAYGKNTASCDPLSGHVPSLMAEEYGLYGGINQGEETYSRSVVRAGRWHFE